MWPAGPDFLRNVPSARPDRMRVGGAGEWPADRVRTREHAGPEQEKPARRPGPRPGLHRQGLRQRHIRPQLTNCCGSPVTGTPWLWTAWTRNLVDLPALVQGLTCNGVPAEFVKESLVPRTPASVKPVDGWTAQLITCGLPKPVEVQGATVTGTPTSAVWTADDAHQIGQNEFQMFTISVGRLPAAGTTMNPARRAGLPRRVTRTGPPSTGQTRRPLPTTTQQQRPPRRRLLRRLPLFRHPTAGTPPAGWGSPRA
jgi:hypothetical protein